jgi:hypothetical protein
VTGEALCQGCRSIGNLLDLVVEVRNFEGQPYKDAAQNIQMTENAASWTYVCGLAVWRWSEDWL